MLSHKLKLADSQLHHAFFEDHPLPGFLIEPTTLKTASVNKAALALFFNNNKTLVNGHFLDLFDLANKFEINKLLQQASLQTTARAICQINKNNGTPATFEAVVNTINLQQPYYYLSLIQVAHQKETEERLNLLDQLVSQTSDALTAADLEFKPTSWNKGAERIFGLKAEDVIGKSLRDFIDINYGSFTVEEVRAAIRTKGTWRGEMFFKRPTDGKDVALISNFVVLKDRDGVPVGYVVTSTDITERKYQESKLKESEVRFREISDVAPVGIWMSNADNKLCYINKSLAAYTGIPAEQHCSELWSTIVHPEDREQATSLYKRHYTRRENAVLVYRLKNNTGSYRWVQDTSKPRILKDGTFLGYIGSVVDIHDTKQKEEQLRYQATILDNVQDSIVTTDLEFRLTSFNTVAAGIFDYTPEVIGTKLNEHTTFDYLTGTRDEAIVLLTTKGIWKGEVAFVTKHGQKKFFLYTVAYFKNEKGERIGVMGVGRDITDRKTVEQKLQQSENFYRQLIADSADGMLLSNAEGNITFVSPPIKNILGYTKEELLGKNVFSFVHLDDQIWAISAFEREITENPEVKSISIRIRKSDGNWLWCMIRGHNALKNPYIKSMVIYMHDDTMRKNASEALKESEKRFRSLIRDLKLGVVLQDKDAKILLCNEAATTLLGLTEDQLLGVSSYDPLWNVIKEDGRNFPGPEHPVPEAIRTKKPVRDVIMGVYHPQLKSRVWLLVNADPILNANNELIHVICSFADITERKRIQQEQLKHQKQLTQATIDGQEQERKEIGKELHDNIGQRLTTTKLYLDLAKATADDNTAEMVMLALRSVNDVINELRSLSHALVPSTLGDIGLIESVQELIVSYSYLKTMQVTFDHADFDEDCIQENQKLMLYRVLQEQINNIMKHAKAQKVDIFLKSNKKFVYMQVQDNGSGFVLNSLRKSLGLTNIKNRVDLFGGKVKIVTSPGKGCSIKVIIPINFQE